MDKNYKWYKKIETRRRTHKRQQLLRLILIRLSAIEQEFLTLKKNMLNKPEGDENKL